MKIIVMENKKESDYTLLARVNDNDEVHEYVVAWNFRADGTWSQGHYFPKTELVSAMKFMYEKEIIQKLIKVYQYVHENLDVMCSYEELVEEDGGSYFETLLTDGLAQD